MLQGFEFNRHNKVNHYTNDILKPFTTFIPADGNQCKSIKIDHITEVSYHNFHTNYLKPNKPCIISSSSTEKWKSRRDWVTSEGQPNFNFLLKEFGELPVPITDCNRREYNSQCKTHMVFKDYLEYWQKLNFTEKENQPCFYLKDFHFVREYPHWDAYETPDYFHSDWLNESCGTESDDFKFVYMGPKGTWTPLHSDVFGSYSWSANVCGRKRWLLFPPGQEKCLMDKHNQLPYSYELDPLKYNVSYIEVTQEPGEIIFVPSGWYHQVWNMEDTISINHNWFNACNILYIWHQLKKAASDVENEIGDCMDSEDFQDQCQILLKVHHGMNYEEFLQLIKFIWESRLKCLNSLSFDCSEHWETVFDVEAIKSVCRDMLTVQNKSIASFLTDIKINL